MHCDWHPRPGRAHLLRSTVEPPTLADNPSDLDRLTASSPASGSPRNCAPSCPSSKTWPPRCATPTGGRRSPSRWATWCTALPAAAPDRHAAGDERPRRQVRPGGRRGHDQRGGLPGRLHHRPGDRSASAYNRQISAAKTSSPHRLLARETASSTCRPRRRDHERAHRQAQERTGVTGRTIHEAAVAANTTMTHLLLGLDPVAAQHPTSPPYSWPPRCWPPKSASSQPRGPRARMPAVGSYIGGDITAGVHHSGLFATDQVTLFLDIGTNGEIVLGTKDWLISCACSAGPAFEGGGVEPRHAGDRRRHRGVWVNAHVRIVVSHHRQLARRRPVRQRPDRPARRALRDRHPRPLGPHRHAPARAPRVRGRRSAPVRRRLGRRGRRRQGHRHQRTRRRRPAARQSGRSTRAIRCSAAAWASTWPTSSRSS